MAPVSDMEVEMSSVSGAGGRRRREASPLSRDDCLCPVCLEIFVEPVTLPCTHTFCKECFQESVDKATLCCPMCRRRVSTWARQHSRNNTLVNQQLWTQIQTCFPLQCERRLKGQETEEDTYTVCFPRVSQPGELRQEYEDQVTKLTEERRVLAEEESKASEELIQKLLQEEQQLLQEETRRREEDERLARLLSNQLNSPVVSQEDRVPPAKKKKTASVGQIERFLFPRSPQSSFMSNKENILLSERHLLKPDHRGPPGHIQQEPEEEQLHPRTPTRTHGGALKRRSSEIETDEEEEEAISSPGVCVSSSSSVEAGFLQHMAEREAELQGRWQQEEEDRRLAQLLQKELDQEERRRVTDRRKGSTDAYLLRQSRGGTDEAGSSKTPGRASKRTSKTFSSSSSSPSTSSSSSASSVKTPKACSSSSSSSTRSKQTTLTEMFSTLSS